jgi:hypothetical protein
VSALFQKRGNAYVVFDGGIKIDYSTQSQFESEYNHIDMENYTDLKLLAPIFWDVDVEQLSWKTNRDFIIRRVLTHGNMEMIRWLRVTLGNEELVRWLKKHDGAGLSPRQLRFWEVILDLPDRLVDGWIKKDADSIWRQRIS